MEGLQVEWFEFVAVPKKYCSPPVSSPVSGLGSLCPHGSCVNFQIRPRTNDLLFIILSKINDLMFLRHGCTIARTDSSELLRVWPRIEWNPLP